jgi:hypothetical protein
MKRLTYALILTLLTTVICMSALEVLMRTGLIVPMFNNGQIGFVLDEHMLYRLGNYELDVLNNAGYFDIKEFRTDKGALPRMVFLGDSFMMGVGVGMQETIPARFEAFTGGRVEAFNLGVRGYGPDQSYMQLLDTGLSYKPDMVVLGLFPANDFNDLAKNSLVTLDADGKALYNPDNIVSRETGPMKSVYLLKYLAHRYLGAGFFGPLFKTLLADGYDHEMAQEPASPASERKRALMRGVLRALRDTLKQADIPFFVLIIPSKGAVYLDEAPEAASNGLPDAEHPFALEDEVARICADEGIPHLDASPLLLSASSLLPGDANYPGGPLYNNEDANLSPWGTRLVAGALLSQVARMGRGGSGR